MADAKQGNKTAQRTGDVLGVGEWHWRWRSHTESDDRRGAACRTSLSWARSQAHPEGDQDLTGGFWTGLTWSDLDFLKTILLLGELSEPRRATPMIIYNDLISPRKHRLTLEGKKLGKVRCALWPHRESSIGDEGVLCVHSFNPLNRPRTAGLLLPFYRWRNQEVQRFEGHASIQWQSWGSKQTVWGQSLRRQKHPCCL